MIENKPKKTRIIKKKAVRFLFFEIHQFPPPPHSRVVDIQEEKKSSSNEYQAEFLIIKKWSGNVLGLCIDDDDDYDDSGGRWSDMYLVITRWCVCEWNEINEINWIEKNLLFFVLCNALYATITPPPLHDHRR